MRLKLPLWIAALTGVGALALSSAHYMRYDLVEPAAVGAFCETASTNWKCLIRHAIISLLTEHRLGWLAVTIALLSVVFGVTALGWCAWFVATAAFVLYNAELAAPALLLAGVALSRARHRVDNRRQS